jgi:hypothetical protein
LEAIELMAEIGNMLVVPPPAVEKLPQPRIPPEVRSTVPIKPAETLAWLIP